MTLRIREFAKNDFAEYQSWFADDQLRRELEGVDQEWLDHVLADPTGKQFVVVDAATEELVSVVGICLPTAENPVTVITDIAVRPELRGNGIGRASIEIIVNHLRPETGMSWGAYVARTNSNARQFFSALGWRDCSQLEDEMHFFVATEDAIKEK